MEVTRETFPELLKSILISIEEAEFVAIDCEYSGICIARSSSLQTPAERYLQTKEAAELFTVVQFGICPVKWISEKNEFQCSPYNFNISPTLFDRIKDRGLNRHYSNQAGSIDFLLQHGFDFNKQLTEGLYYLNEQEESLLLKYGTAQKTELQHDLKAARGIRIVLEHISKTKKPIIGHNVFGDITRIYCNLMKGTLPDTLPDFCLRITNAFPTIIDTKYLARREARLGISDDTSLSRLASWVDEHGVSGPQLGIAEFLETCSDTVAIRASYLRYVNQQKDHEAGYDALNTAKVFIGLASRIERLRAVCPVVTSAAIDEGLGDSEDEVQIPRRIAQPCPLKPFKDAEWSTVTNIFSINGTVGDGYLNLRRPCISPISVSATPLPTLFINPQPKQGADPVAIKFPDKTHSISPSWHTAPRVQHISREYSHETMWKQVSGSRSQKHYSDWRGHYKNYPNLLNALSKLDAHDNHLSKQILHDYGLCLRLHSIGRIANVANGENPASPTSPEENFATYVWHHKDDFAHVKKSSSEEL